MNIDLLLKVRAAILAEPAQFIMASWFAKGSVYHHDEDPESSYDRTTDIPRGTIPNCGTAACIAGWTCAIANGRLPAEQRLFSSGVDFVAEAALGIDQERGALLFYVREWPYDMQQAWLAATTLEARAQVAAARIDKFVETGGDE